jgi:hypothetical protein
MVNVINFIKTLTVRPGTDNLLIVIKFIEKIAYLYQFNKTLFKLTSFLIDFISLSFDYFDNLLIL